MTKEDAKKDIENIKNDIKSLMNNLGKLKGDSTEVLTDSLEQLSKTVLNVKDNAKSKMQSTSTSLIMKCVTCLYGDTLKKAAISMGVAAIVIYMLKDKD